VCVCVRELIGRVGDEGRKVCVRKGERGGGGQVGRVVREAQVCVRVCMRAGH
jgi:hypothetical protein